MCERKINCIYADQKFNCTHPKCSWSLLWGLFRKVCVMTTDNPNYAYCAYQEEHPKAEVPPPAPPRPRRKKASLLIEEAADYDLMTGTEDLQDLDLGPGVDEEVKPTKSKSKSQKRKRDKRGRYI
jgi:hypothetical protein